MKIIELFAGIGACSKALTRLGIEHEIVDAVEIDKYAVKSFNAIHSANFEPQDIASWDKSLVTDLIMHGSPCQDFSVAGKGAGGDEGSGTRSSLMYETLRIVDNLRPMYVIWENVPAVLSAKHRHNFDNYIERMSQLGYSSQYSILNAKDFGVPQNRKRVFTVSILGNSEFMFPSPIPLTKTLKDVLEPVVDERYYLPDEKVVNMKFTEPKILKTIQQNRDLVQVGKLDIRGHDAIKRVYSPKGVSPTLTTMGGGQREPKIIDPQVLRVGGLYDTDQQQHQIGSVYSDDGISPTLDTMGGGNRQPMIVASRGRNPENTSDRTSGAHTEQHLEVNMDGVSNTLTSVQKDNMVLEPSLRVRKLTPKECWRLMGFDDEDFEKARNTGMSNTQLYKQAGNSIVVNVLEAILDRLLKGRF